MDDQIAPVDGTDPIARYRAYIASHTGSSFGFGAAPAPDEDIAPTEQGSGPSIAPVAPQAAPQAARFGPGAAPSAAIAPIAPGTPMAGIAPVAAAAPQAPVAPSAAGPVNPGSALGPQPLQAPDMIGDPNQVRPAESHRIKGKTTSDGKPMVPTAPPDHDPSTAYDQDKLKDAHTPADILDAMKPKERDKYMDWWEQQHGDINQRYDQMRAQLGQRPDPNREPTRQEKFAELTTFGLQLMQNARRGNDAVAAVGQSAQQAIGAQKAKQQQQTQDYDTRANAIETQRQNQLKDIGNYGNAVRESAMIKNQEVQTAKAYAAVLKPPKTGQPVTRVTPDGTQLQYNQDTGAWDVSMTSDGKPVKINPNVGPRGGAGKSPARMAEFNDLVTNQGVDKNRALALVYGSGGVKSSDPQKTYSNIYSKARGLGEDPDQAATEADAVTKSLHGENWRTASAENRQPAIPPTPPKVAPPVGKIGTDAQGNKWKNDGKGNAVLVSRAS